MDGEIGVTGKPGVDSAFRFTARFDKQLDSVEKQPESPPDIRGKRFLIMDDYTNKPIRPQELLNTIEKQIKRISSGSEESL
ncbi:MAG: hypothetical protein PVG39_15235 [Desulfobacteraceae bacterium]